MVDPRRDDLMRTLSEHPGFRALIAMYDEQAAALESKLVNERQKTLEDYVFLQTGIKWLRYAQNCAKQAVDKRLEAMAVLPVPTQEEQLRAALEKFESI